MSGPTISQAGINLIKKWEGLYLKAYVDPVGVLTIGYGSITNRKLGIIVKEGMTLPSAEVAEDYMRREIVDFEDDMLRLIKVPLNQNQWDALASFIYNVGIGNFRRSTLLKVLNKGRYKAVPTQLMRWNKGRNRKTAAIITLRGLTNRRADEVKMWNGEGIANTPAPDVQHVSVPKEDILPSTNDAALKQATTQSPTGKIATLQIGGAMLAALQAADPLTLALAGLVAVMGAYILYRKVRDLREFVQ